MFSIFENTVILSSTFLEQGISNTYGSKTSTHLSPQHLSSISVEELELRCSEARVKDINKIIYMYVHIVSCFYFFYVAINLLSFVFPWFIARLAKMRARCRCRCPCSKTKSKTKCPSAFPIPMAFTFPAPADRLAY